jgi:O-antigen/teichoic acid export membrane protein
MTEHRNKLGAGVRWAMFDNLAQQVLSFLIFMVLARFVAPQDFGLIAIAHVMVTFIRQTLFSAISLPITRVNTPSNALYSWGFWICVFLAVLMSSVMLAGAGFVSRFYAQPELIPVLSWMSLVVLTTGMAAIYEARLMRQMAFKPLAIRSIASVTIGGSIGIFLAFHDAGVFALIAQQVITSCIGLILLVGQSRWLPQIKLRGTDFSEVLTFAPRVGMTGLFGFLASQGDTLLVSVLLGSYATGIYSFAKRLTSAVYLVIGSSLLKLALPAFTEAGRKPEALRDVYLRMFGTSLFLMAPLLAGISVLAKPLITLFFGLAWVPAAPVVALLALLYILLAINQLNDNLMLAVGTPSVSMMRGLAHTALSLILGSLLSALGLGLSWVAAGFVLAGAIVWPWPQLLANRHTNLSTMKLASAMKSPAIATLAMVAFLLLTSAYLPQNALAFGAVVIGGAIVYFVAHFFVMKTWPHSYDALRDLLHRRGVVRPSA